MRAIGTRVVLIITLMALTIPATASDTISKREIKLWNRAAMAQTEYEQRHAVINNPRLTAYLDSVLSRLWAQVQTDLSPMTVKVIQDTALNALTYPNGVCYITSGMLVHIRNEDQLAMVLAHEMVHYVRRHALNAMAFNNKNHSMHTIGSNSGATTDKLKKPNTLAAYNNAAEMQADREGLALLIKAEFDTHRVIALLDGFRCDNQKDHQNSQLMPGDTIPRDRRMMIRSLIKNTSGQSADEKLCLYDPNYLSQVLSALQANAQAAIKMGLWEQAAEDVAKYIDVFPDDPNAHFLLGELYRCQSAEGRAKACIQAYQQAIRLDNAFAPAYRELGVVHFKMGQKKTARQLFETYLALVPQDESRVYIRQYLNLCGKK